MLPGSGDPKELGFYFALSQVGMEMVAPLVAGALLDYYLNWGPWGAIAGALFGLAAGMTHLIMLLNQRNRTKASQRQQDSR
jgi:F0F1-type ATP synthase assembly protein I